MTLAYLTLFCVMCFAIVPLVIRLFITLQVRIGNGEFILVKWFQVHEQAAVYAGWGILGLGICIAVVLAKDDILKSMR